MAASSRRLDPAVVAGVLLVAAAVIAMIAANSQLAAGYRGLWDSEIAGVSVRFAINDGLMAIFFLLVGLEIKREIAGGSLSTPGALGLPVAAAIGGMVVPALIFAAIANGGAGAAGWPIPVATDIAFAIAAVAVLGKRLPGAVRALLLAIAVIDDLGAVLIIAVLFSSSLDLAGLAIAGLGLGIGLASRRLERGAIAGYAAGFVVAWLGLLVAGIHPTLAGVAIGLMVPATGKDSLAERAEHRLAPLVTFAIMPLFALANAGVTVDLAALASGSESLVFAGVAAGLIAGKPLGVIGGALIAVRLGLARLPGSIGVGALAVIGLACGVGFTMSIFIAELAFVGSASLLAAGKLGVVAASALTLAATVGVGLAVSRARPASRLSSAPTSPPSRSPRPLGA